VEASRLRKSQHPIVMNGKMYFLARSNPGTSREGERVVCLMPIPEKTFGRILLTSGRTPDTRVGWSAVVGDPETGNVYALGVRILPVPRRQYGKDDLSKSLHEIWTLSTYGGQ
jgi:hypothetical protein